MERVHWEFNALARRDALIGSNRSLVAPHEYELGLATPGRHRLTIRIDNRLAVLPYRPDGHSVSDSLGGAWNGIVGAIELRASSPVWIDDAQAYPNAGEKSVRVRVRIGNLTGAGGSGMLAANGVAVPVTWDASGGTAEAVVKLGDEAKLWDEFSPALQFVDLRLSGPDAADARRVVFGLRDFHTQGNQFILNGSQTYFRGTHDGGDFPLTGYPPTDVDSWRRIFRTCQDWGLNLMRFHSFCPPEAAFTAADELGFYLQPECGMWDDLSPGTPMERQLYDETCRMVRAYGNHPSFLLLSASNEPKGRWQQSLTNWVAHFREADPRHLYTTGTGWSLINAPGPVNGADFLTVAHLGPTAMVRGRGAWFGGDFSESVRGVNAPVLSHELGQWCAYPKLLGDSQIHRFFAPWELRNFPRFAGRARHGGAGLGICLGLRALSDRVLQGGNRGQSADRRALGI